MTDVIQSIALMAISAAVIILVAIDISMWR